jgi:hypothetical protein
MNYLVFYLMNRFCIVKTSYFGGKKNIYRKVRVQNVMRTTIN